MADGDDRLGDAMLLDHLVQNRGCPQYPQPMDDHADLGRIVVQEAHRLNTQIRSGRNFLGDEGPGAAGPDEDRRHFDQTETIERMVAQPLIPPARAGAQEDGGEDAQEIVNKKCSNRDVRRGGAGEQADDPQDAAGRGQGDDKTLCLKQADVTPREARHPQCHEADQLQQEDVGQGMKKDVCFGRRYATFKPDDKCQPIGNAKHRKVDHGLRDWKEQAILDEHQVPPVELICHAWPGVT